MHPCTHVESVKTWVLGACCPEVAEHMPGPLRARLQGGGGSQNTALGGAPRSERVLRLVPSLAWPGMATASAKGGRARPWLHARGAWARLPLYARAGMARQRIPLGAVRSPYFGA